MRTEFVTFVVKRGMEAEAERWMRLLVQRQQECIATLEQERMHYESIFRSIRGGRLFADGLARLLSVARIRIFASRTSLRSSTAPPLPSEALDLSGSLAIG